MELVWKDPAVVNDETLSRKSRESGCRSGKGSQHRAFKFMRGRPKRRRKSRNTNTVYQSTLDLGSDNTPRRRVTHSPNSICRNDQLSASNPEILNFDDVGVSRGWVSQSCGSVTYQLQHATHLSPGWQLLSGRIDSVDGHSIHESWPDTAEPDEPPNQLILDLKTCFSSNIDVLDQANNDPADGLFPVAGCESCSGNYFAERNANHDRVEEDAQPIFPIKYRDLAHKYRPFLALCM